MFNSHIFDISFSPPRMFGLNNKSPMSTFSKSMAPRGNTDVLRTPDSFLRPFEQGVVPEAFLGATSTPICDSRNGYPPKPGLSLLESLRSPLISNVPDLISRKGGKNWKRSAAKFSPNRRATITTTTTVRAKSFSVLFFLH